MNELRLGPTAGCWLSPSTVDLAQASPERCGGGLNPWLFIWEPAFLLGSLLLCLLRIPPHPHLDAHVSWMAFFFVLKEIWFLFLEDVPVGCRPFWEPPPRGRSCYHGAGPPTMGQGLPPWSRTPHHGAGTPPQGRSLHHGAGTTWVSF